MGGTRPPEVLGNGLAAGLEPRVGGSGLTPGPLPCGAALAAGTVRSYIHTSLPYIATMNSGILFDGRVNLLKSLPALRGLSSCTANLVSEPCKSLLGPRNAKLSSFFDTLAKSPAPAPPAPRLTGGSE